MNYIQIALEQTIIGSSMRCCMKTGDDHGKNYGKFLPVAAPPEKRLQAKESGTGKRESRTQYLWRRLRDEIVPQDGMQRRYHSSWLAKMRDELMQPQERHIVRRGEESTEAPREEKSKQ
uniref:Uncharacterized protein n=1 Tax=Glossina austeni TaxID=7395 RepID=A0A1A9UKT8_GLOAU